MNNSESYVGKPDNQKTPEALEEEVNQTRARIDDRLQVLSNRLSPGELVDQVLGMAREHGGDFTRNLGSQMKNNPVPTILTGIGLAWLMMSSGNRAERHSSPGNRYRYADDEIDDLPQYQGRTQRFESTSSYDAESAYNNGIYDATEASAGYYDEDARTASYAGSAKSDDEPGIVDKARDALDELGEQAAELKRSVRDKGHRASEAAHRGVRSARRGMHSARGSLQDFLHEQPVLAASLGVALGAALGALLPATETEERVLGSASEKAINKAETMASSQYSKARASAQMFADNARQVLQGDGSSQSSADSISPGTQAR